MGLPKEKLTGFWLPAAACLLCYFSKAPLAPGVIVQRRPESRGPELRPHAIGEIKFGIRALPQQKIAEPLLRAGSNEQVHSPSRRPRMIHPVQQLLEPLCVEAGL